MRGFRGAFGGGVFGVLLVSLACGPAGGYGIEVVLTDGTVEDDTCRIVGVTKRTITCGRTWNRDHVVSYRLIPNPTDSTSAESEDT